MDKIIMTSDKPVARCFDDGEGNEYQVAYFDGYDFGDRLLAGVMFQAELLPDGRLQVQVCDEYFEYFSNLNMTKFTTMALEHAKQNDLFQELPNGGRTTLAFVN